VHTIVSGLGTQLGFAESESVKPGWHRRLHDGKVLVERPVSEQRSRDQMSNAASHVRFGRHDVMAADSFEDSAVGLGDRFRPDVVNAKVNVRGCRQHARFDIRADAWGNSSVTTAGTC
jgi:hypothetical protein